MPHDQKKPVIDAAGKFFYELDKATQNLDKEDLALTPPPRGTDVDKDNWSQFARQELVEMIGREDISSISEAFLKATSLLRGLQRSASEQRCFLFRGQRDISWPLLPRKGRALKEADWIPPAQPLSDQRMTRILPEEIEGLETFRNQWETIESVEDIDRAKKLPDDHPEWWFRMQHYGNGEGTRLLDLTTSLTSALLFACVDWKSGLIDDTTDGIVYLWEEGRNGNVDNFLLKKLPDTADQFFTNYPDAPVYILNPPHNERSKAQSGAFIWWPIFWEEPRFGDPYFLRVIAKAKTDIVRDLLSLGFGPKDAVRGIKGLQNEHSLRKQLVYRLGTLYNSRTNRGAWANPACFAGRGSHRMSRLSLLRRRGHCRYWSGILILHPTNQLIIAEKHFGGIDCSPA